MHSFKPSSCPVGSSPVLDKLKSSGSSPDKLKRAGSITDVATKQGMFSAGGTAYEASIMCVVYIGGEGTGLVHRTGTAVVV